MAREDTSGAGVGARVTDTGIALVHAGEVILAAPGSEAETEQLLEDSRMLVQYYFPVEIEVRGAPDAVAPEAILAETLHALHSALEEA